MEIQNKKTLLAFATVGLGTMMSTNAMANDFENSPAYEGVKMAQQHVQQAQSIDLNNPVFEMQLPDSVLESYNEESLSESEPEIDAAVIEETNMSENYKDDMLDGIGGEEPVPEENVNVSSEQVEMSCDRDLNAPSVFAKIGAWVMKAGATIATLKTGGAAAIPSAVIHNVADSMLMNGCDEFDTEAAVVDVGTSAIIQATGVGVIGGYAIETVADYGYDKYKENREEKERLAQAEKERLEQETQVAMGGEVIDGTSIDVTKTSDTIEVPEVEDPSVGSPEMEMPEVDEPVITMKIDRSAIKANQQRNENANEYKTSTGIKVKIH